MSLCLKYSELHDAREFGRCGGRQPCILFRCCFDSVGFRCSRSHKVRLSHYPARMHGVHASRNGMQCCKMRPAHIPNTMQCLIYQSSVRLTQQKGNMLLSTQGVDRLHDQDPASAECLKLTARVLGRHGHPRRQGASLPAAPCTGALEQSTCTQHMHAKVCERILIVHAELVISDPMLHPSKHAPLVMGTCKRACWSSTMFPQRAPTTKPYGHRMHSCNRLAEQRCRLRRPPAQTRAQRPR